ncbi:hypothetical protein [Variovorax sp. OV329]|uniref:hypothetical protein n=1 Tax=Variovorax sp. OV329 TaxID=1882825 RepID=UPI0008E378A4|nr:hypothetical protein [Variovorax sp. OV329]SFL96439.1 hypothetical protein SAMN05444747_101488 [Variovorax sp. OV329]
MTGLLHRLAARATGTGWTVRSDLRLPWDAAGLASTHDDAPPIESALPGVRAPVRDRQDSPAAHSHESPRAVSRRAQEPVVADEPVAPLSTLEQSAPAKELPKPRMPAARQPPAASHASAKDAGVQARATAQTSERPQPSPRQRQGEPAPLLPARPATASHAALSPRAGQGLAAFQVASHTQAAAGQETEVHIHIGRIDVTALHESPRPKARPRERTQAVSLDAYLAARSKQ